MSGGHWCPADDCDFGDREFKTKSSVKNHINGKGNDPAHADKSALREAVERQEAGGSDPSADDTGEETAEPTNEPAESDESNPVEPPAEATEATDTDPDDMATDDEYQQQQANSGGEPTDDSATDTDESTDDSGGGSAPEAAAAAAGGAGLLGRLGVNPLVLVGIAVLALLVWSLYADTGGESDPKRTEATGERVESGEPDPAEPAGEGGGLVGA